MAKRQPRSPKPSAEHEDPFDALDDSSIPPAGSAKMAPVQTTNSLVPVPLVSNRADNSVMLDKRNMTKKQQLQLQSWHGTAKVKALDTYMAGSVRLAQAKFGSSLVMAGNSTENLLVVIPSPSLAFEYVIGQDGFPLGLIMHLNGPPGSNKSSLLFEFMRWFVMAGGVNNYIEVESKMSPDLMPSIVGYDNAKYVTIDFARSVEEWQQRLLFWLKTHKDRLNGTKDDPGPGRTIPILLGVDSIMGKLSEESQENIRDVGHGGRSFPVEALQITQIMKTIPHSIVDWPFSIVLNNHMKMGKDKNGRDVRRTGGGCGVNFQESFELETGVVKQKIQCAEWIGRIISIKCHKSSFGDTYRRINTRVLWAEEQDPDTGKWRQTTMWDWHWATVNMLSNLEGRAASRVKDVFHLAVPTKSDVENTAWSSSLGMTAKDAVPWTTLGGMIAADAKVTNMLREALGIKHRPVLAGDYRQQRAELATVLP